VGKKVLGALIAGGILVAAGFVTAIVSAPDTAVAQENSDSTEPRGPMPRIMGFLSDVLDGLVSDGTIDRSQADAIATAAEDKAAQVKEDFRAQRDQIEGFLEDDVITEDEASQLPEDSFLFSDVFDQAWEDGRLTRDEIAAARPHPRRDWFRRGFHFRGLLDDGGIDRAEYDALPDDSPLKKVDVSEYLKDGKITPDELREIFQDLVPSRLGANA
jgi:polyhydroxyalkanoate synthesis regulator phasin